MTTKKQQATRLVDVTTKDLQQILLACLQLDNESFKNGVSSNKFKNLLEIQLYKQFCIQKEDIDKAVTFNFTDSKILSGLTRSLPYIIGLDNFNISYSRQTKETILSAFLKRPTGNYKKTLEENGLVFEYIDNEEVINTEQQEAIAEANSILSAYGLSSLSF